MPFLLKCKFPEKKIKDLNCFILYATLFLFSHIISQGEIFRRICFPEFVEAIWTLWKQKNLIFNNALEQLKSITSLKHSSCFWLFSIKCIFVFILLCWADAFPAKRNKIHYFHNSNHIIQIYWKTSKFN